MSNLLHSAHGSAYPAGPLHSLPPHTRKVGSALRTGFARPHVRHAVRSSFSSGMNANQPDRPGLARNADALKTLMPLGNNRHRPLLSRTLTTESVGRGFEPCRPRWKRLSSTLENAGLVGSQRRPLRCRPVLGQARSVKSRGCTETATKSSPINAPVALAVAKKTRGTPEGSPGRC